MLVTPESVVGTVGGGHLEYLAVAQARSGGGSERWVKEYPLGAALGQCCGGAMTLSYEVLSAEHLTALQADCAALKTLFLFGAGHVACALIPIIAAMPLRVVWVDTRDVLNQLTPTFPAQLPSHITPVVTDTPEAELRQAQVGDLALIMTHSHALDAVLTQAALSTHGLAYIGLIGSATKRRLFEQRLIQRGFAQANLMRLTCPVGAPISNASQVLNASLSANKQYMPAMIAVQIAAQLAQYM